MASHSETDTVGVREDPLQEPALELDRLTNVAIGFGKAVAAGPQQISRRKEITEEEAGEENRTPVLSLEGSCSAIELRPRRHPS